MNHDRMLAILSALAGGTDPVTGAVFPPGSPYQQPETIRALFLALRALEDPAAIPPRQAVASAAPATPSLAADADDRPRPARKPAKSRAAPQGGKPWTADDDTQLAAGFDAGTAPDDLAKSLGRSRLSVEIRLAKLGRMAMPANARFGAHRIDTASAASRSADTISVHGAAASLDTVASAAPAAAPDTVADATRPRYVVGAPRPASVAERRVGAKRASGVTQVSVITRSSGTEPPSGARHSSGAASSTGADYSFDPRTLRRYPPPPPPVDAVLALSRLVARTLSSRSGTP